MSKLSVKLVCLTDVTAGGWLTYIGHLAHGLKLRGHEVEIVKQSNHTEAFTRKFGYNLTYRNYSPKDILKLEGQVVVCATHINYRDTTMGLLKAGAAIVVHDPTEFRKGGYYEFVRKHVTVVVRESMLRHFKPRRTMFESQPGGLYIPHCYVRASKALRDSFDVWYKRKQLAVSLARLDFDKKTEWILEANDELPEDRKVELYGAEHRPYTRLVIKKRWPKWVQRNTARYNRDDLYEAVKKASTFKYMIDMSDIKGDGGGTQYSFLEAMDAGCICVLNKAWTDAGGAKGEMQPGKNCIVVKDSEQLCWFLSGAKGSAVDSSSVAGAVTAGAAKVLAAHAPEKVIPMWEELLKV